MENTFFKFLKILKRADLMKVEQLKTINNNKILKGPLLLSPSVFSDNRGFFLESWNQVLWNELLDKFEQAPNDFVQDNHSCSKLGVLRGLHYQLPPDPQGKLVRCVHGEIFDVAIDIRKSSSTFLQTVGVHLSENNFHQLWIPNGFAHGFLTLSEQAHVLYKTTRFWSPSCERSIHWNDPQISIQWPSISTSKLLSKKDSEAPFIDQLSPNDFFE